MWYTSPMANRTNGLAKQFSVTIGDRGRLVLPAALRTQLHLQRNDRVLLTLETDGSVRLSASRGKIDSAAGMYAPIARGRDLVAELLRERRKEVREERKR
ncbi:MAG: AbrB/MazE/SpoVT family DNA-binding domain-containing protein [Planctomycetes bacterium]|nr:AbrB/MazE/SpoVT family DNA-binding domain-containing protein [Planctomycetota bacterium]